MIPPDISQFSGPELLRKDGNNTTSIQEKYSLNIFFSNGPLGTLPELLCIEKRKIPRLLYFEDMAFKIILIQKA